jgi:2,3-bisphosphoglycerate-independent phosphoglycerate mutase
MNNEMKYIVLLGDGMADLPVESLGNRTPLQHASTPNMDRLARSGICGMVRTVPEGMSPGSDTANLSVFGYDPSVYYTGRAPLEALNMGIDLGPGDVAFRCNIVNINDDIMKDFSGGHIDTAFTKIVMEEISRNIQIKDIEFHAGVSYRNIMVWRNYPHEEVTRGTPPHDITDRRVAEYLPSGPGSDTLREIMEKSQSVIAGSKAIREAAGIYRGKPQSLWLWGAGRKPSIQTLEKRFGLRGVTISAVDLIHGIGRAAGLTPLPVEGATGYIDTNYEGKASALLSALEKNNFVYLHVESPDESGHEGNLEHKLRSIEDFDEKVVGPVMEGMKKYENYAILLMPDHPTPVSIKTHSPDMVPFCMFRTGSWNDESLKNRSAQTYDEISAAGTGLVINEGHRLIELMINGKL